MCPVCRRAPSQIGVLCEECRDELAAPRVIAPEQIELHVVQPTVSALVDRWGRPQRLEVQTQVGRKVEGGGLAIFDASVSRHHATVRLQDGVWSVRDLESANGTFVDGRLVEQPVPLHNADQVRFGEVGFFFLADISGLPPPRPSRTMSRTIRPMDVASTQQPVEPPRRSTGGLPVLAFELHEPTGGGGGLVEIEGKRVQLTTPQLELVTVLVERMLTETDRPEPMRGFVPSSELMTTVSWDAPDPGDDHVRQLVRRVRRLLVKAGIDDVIESRHGYGYRLRATPRVKPPAR
jgi:pSer/pThr/pTyr-binding forkhead associated (FHA) protein